MAALDPRLVVTEVPIGVDAGVVNSITPSAGPPGVASIIGSPQVLTLLPAPVTPPTPTVTVLSGVVRFSVTWHLGQPEDLSYTVNGPGVGTLTPGQQPGNCRVLGSSLDGGAHQESRMLSSGSQVLYQQPTTVGESGKGLGAVLATARISRTTAQQITVAAAFNGAANTIPTTSGAMIAPGLIVPDLEGIAHAAIGLPGSKQAALLSFTYVIHPAVAAIRIDLDVNRDNPLRATEAITERLGSAVDPQLAQFVLDAGDFGIAGGSKTVAVGFKGTAPHLTFDGVTVGPTAQPILRGSQGQAQTQDMVASVRLSGGGTHHGMPDGGSITQIRTINHAAGDATGNYRSGLLVAGIYVNRDQGGVAFWPGDDTLHWMSQQMGVTDLLYDENVPILYAATELGVYSHSADPGDPSPWTRLGGMALKVLKLVKNFSTLYALVEFQSNGQRHVLQYPALGGQVDGYGYDGWSVVTSHAGIADFGVVTGAADTLYYLAGDIPTAVGRHLIGSAADDTYLIPANSAVPVGLDVLTQDDDGSTVTGIVVRTSAGSDGLYAIQGDSSTLIAMGATLRDQFGAAVVVNSVSPHGAGALQWTTGSRPVSLFACTNVGLFVSDQPFGGNWARTTGQNSLGDVSLTRVASAPPRKWLGRMRSAVYATTGTTLLVSWNGTVNFVDAFAKPLDWGPAFFALWKKQRGVYPDNVATTLQYPDPAKGPYLFIRGLNGIGEYDYTLYNMRSQAPGGAHRDVPIPQISTTALISEARASVVLLDEGVRLLGYWQAAQQVLEIESMFSDTADPLRTLRPGHMVLVNGPITEYLSGGAVTYVTYANQPFWVLDHTISYDAEQDPHTCTTRTRLGTLLLDNRSDPARVIGDMSYMINRTQLYGTGA